MKNELKNIFIICIFFSLYFVADKTLFSTIYHGIENTIDLYPLSYFTTYLIVGIPVFLFVFFSDRYQILKPLGLKSNFFQAIAFSFIFTVPMFIGYGIMAGFQISLAPKDFWFGVVFAAFFEELYYRGFFFGQLFKKTRLGFLSAVVLGALIFASLHLYQSDDPATLFGIFIITFMGAGFFAWMFVEWDYNLWVPIGLHFFMNLSWTIFSISDNAFGNLTANLIRGLTILFAITGTIYLKKRKNIPLTINRKTLFFKSKGEPD